MLQSLDFYRDLKAYWVKGFGHALSWQIASPLLRDIYTSIANFITGENFVVGNFRFAHAETLLPLVCLLRHNNSTMGQPLTANMENQYQAERWFKTSRLSPFAANVGFHLYQCGTSYKVHITLNEEDFPVNGCGEDGLICTLDELEHIFSRYLYEWSFDAECRHWVVYMQMLWSLFLIQIVWTLLDVEFRHQWHF